MEMDLSNKKFKFTMPVLKSGSEGKDFFLEGEASNKLVDLENDKMEQSAIDSMKQQAMGLNGYLNHNYGLEDILGSIVEVKDMTTKLWVKFKIMPSKVAMIKEILDSGAKLGLSIGGMIKEWTRDGDIRKILDVKLLEISLTPFPANWGTFGTVSMTEKGQKVVPCFGGICKQIVKSINKKYFNEPINDANKDLQRKTKEQNFVSLAGFKFMKSNEVKKMEEKEFATMVADKVAESIGETMKSTMEESNKQLIEGIGDTFKDIFKENGEGAGEGEGEGEPGGEEKELDLDAVAEKSANMVLKAMGFKPPKEPEEPETKGIDENKVASLVVEKLMAERGNNSRKSKASTVGGKFEVEGETTKSNDETGEGAGENGEPKRKSITQIAKNICNRNGLTAK